MKIKAPIDNKNVLEDFTESFHNGEYIERMEGKNTCQVFFLCGCLCEILYRYGQNWFEFRIIEGDNADVCNRQLKTIIDGMNDNGIIVEYDDRFGLYGFYLVES